MLTTKVKQGIQIVVSLLVAIWIFWFLYKDIELTSLIAQLRATNWFWIFLSLSISVAGYWLRGWRWALLIHPEEGEKTNAGRAYHSMMVGYLVNLLIPRAGEVARCGVLSRTNGIPFGHLLGTVILERSIDLLFLVSIIILAFLVENQLFLALVDQLIDLTGLAGKLLSNLPYLIGGIAIIGFAIFLLARKFRNHGVIKRAQNFGRQLSTGLRSVSSLKNPMGFWASSVVIWLIYFLTMYSVSLGIESTANLTPGEVLMVMVMGTIGMVAPVQGGIGTFHALVAYILIQFGVSESDGKIFAAIIHGTQLILVLILGLASWMIMMRIPAWTKPDKR